MSYSCRTQAERLEYAEIALEKSLHLAANVKLSHFDLYLQSVENIQRRYNRIYDEVNYGIFEEEK